MASSLVRLQVQLNASHSLDQFPGPLSLLVTLPASVEAVSPGGHVVGRGEPVSQAGTVLSDGGRDLAGAEPW